MQLSLSTPLPLLLSLVSFHAAFGSSAVHDMHDAKVETMTLCLNCTRDNQCNDDTDVSILLLYVRRVYLIQFERGDSRKLKDQKERNEIISPKSTKSWMFQLKSYLDAQLVNSSVALRMFIVFIRSISPCPQICMNEIQIIL